MIKKILKEPFFHFLVLGIGLFVVYGALNTNEIVATDDQIVISAGRLRQLQTIFQKTWQRAPTEQEMQGLIDDYVLEEIYYRKAIAMGIDRNDTIIRRRLRQKIEFLNDDASSLVQPSDQQLAEYLQEHPDTFRQPDQYSFRQIYFNPEKHGSNPREWLVQQCETLNQAGDVPGDPSLLPAEFELADARSIDGTFGYGFASQLDRLPEGQWAGPVDSGLGLHLVRVDQRAPGRLPKLDEIRPLVAREWSNALRLETRNKINDELRKQYQVIVEWPNDANDSTSGVEAIDSTRETAEGSQP